MDEKALMGGSGCGKGVTGPLLTLEGSGDLPGENCDLWGPEK